MAKKILTLIIVHQNGCVLLGLKKRGFGVGKYNGFGGKVDKGETVEEAAKRELFEEARITANNLKKLGVLDFSWKGKENEVLEVNIFKTTDFSGEPTEGEEMKPQWFDIDKIPYDKMWSDDAHWLPLFLENKKFKGKFMFDNNNNIVKHELN